MEIRLSAHSYWLGILIASISQPLLAAKSASTPAEAIHMQGSMMSLADSMAGIISQNIDDFEASNPSDAEFQRINRDAVLTISAVFSNAAATNPYRGLVDLLLLVKLHRSIYEEIHLPEMGEKIRPFADMWKEFEAQGNRLAQNYIAKEQIDEMDNLVSIFREKFPNQYSVSYVRISEIPISEQKASVLGMVNTLNPFSSVSDATTQIQETRFLAERAMYLASRLPLLTGAFGELWARKILEIPSIASSADNMTRVTTVLEKVQQDYTYNNLTTLISSEREAAIQQAISGVSNEVQTLLTALEDSDIDFEPSLALLLESLKQSESTLAAAQSLSLALGLDQPTDPDAEPLDVNEIKELVVESAQMTRELNGLMETILVLHDAEMDPQTGGVISTSVDLISKDVGRVIDQVFYRILMLLISAAILTILTVIMIRKFR